MANVKFETIWRNYPDGHPCISWEGVWSDFRGASKVLFWAIP